MKKKGTVRAFLQKLDYVLISTALILALCGIVVIFSATRSLDNGTRQMIVQIVAVMLYLNVF